MGGRIEDAHGAEYRPPSRSWTGIYDGLSQAEDGPNKASSLLLVPFTCLVLLVRLSTERVLYVLFVPFLRAECFLYRLRTKCFLYSLRAEWFLYRLRAECAL